VLRGREVRVVIDFSEPNPKSDRLIRLINNEQMCV